MNTPKIFHISEEIKHGQKDYRNNWILHWKLIRRKIFSDRHICPVTDAMKTMRNMHGIWRSWHICYGNMQMKG